MGLNSGAALRGAFLLQRAGKGARDQAKCHGARQKTRRAKLQTARGRALAPILVPIGRVNP